MIKSIFYFHGFMSSSDSTKAQIFKEYIVKNHKNIKLYIPNIADKFTEAIPQLNKLIEESNSNEMVFMGSSLGGFFATHYAECFKSKAVVINPAIKPSDGLKMYLGDNENYANGNKFELTKDDIDAIKALEVDFIKNPKNYLLLCESDDEVLNYLDAVRFYKASYQDISFGGDHSYSRFKEKLEIIKKFIKI